MNISTFKIKITFKDGQSIVWPHVIKLLTTYSVYLDCDTITLYFVKGCESYILSNVSIIEVLSVC